MAYDLTPYCYQHGTTVIHKLNVKIKLVAFGILSFASLWSWYSLAVTVLILSGVSLAARLKIRNVVRGAKPLLLLMLCVTVYRSFHIQPLYCDLEALGDSIFSLLSLMTSFCAGSLLFSTTTAGALRDCFGSSTVSLSIALMLNVIPRFFEMWENSTRAYQARGGKIGVLMLIPLLPLVLERLINGAVKTALALETRCYYNNTYECYSRSDRKDRNRSGH
ncbi:MAG: energy-coupling factor transporter transmembrane protein EcfT [Treponema sp.]|jgi:energy-coupling factor transporter transmembrane protein EcfT|nr:energy-coupling factor transporter transmembrane protein EcfT [Treponema sp.]